MTSPEIEKIFTEIYPQIEPTSAERSQIQNVIAEISRMIERSAPPPEISICFIEAEGSTGLKQTALRNAADVDLFIGLDPKLIDPYRSSSKKQLHEYLQAFFKSLCLKWLQPCLQANGITEIELSYAEHPYLSTKYKGIEIDLVICFDLPAEQIYLRGPITAVDRTPYHSRYIRDHLNSAQQRDVLLFKQFLKCNFIYGDKSPVGQSGFIGYAAELLIVYYQSLYNLFLHFADLQHETIRVDPDIEAVRTVRIPPDRFAGDFLRILDPVDQNRNVAASISARSYYYACDLIQAFLKSPNRDYFRKKDLPKLTDMILDPSERAKYCYVSFQQLVEDHYTKYRDKCYSIMNRCIKESLWEASGESRFLQVTGEVVFDTDRGEFVIAFYTATPRISEKYLRIGPKVNDHPHAEKFKNTHPNSYVHNGVLCVELERSHSSFVAYITDYFQRNGIKNLRVQSVGDGNTTDRNPSQLGNQAMGILHQAVLPHIDWSDALYRPINTF
jgi:tRNA nucleotidyltransferase (CCA-adding enzyme)